MTRSKILPVTLVTLLIGATVALAVEHLGLPGSSVQYATVVEPKVVGGPVTMSLTGVAMRKKVLVVNVYAIGSYVQQGAAVKTAEELAAADVPKMLHLVMERDIDGKEFAQAFQEAVRLNYAAPQFDAEIKTLADLLKAKAVKKGDQFQMIHVPGVGVEFVLNGKSEAVIRNLGFAKAIWDIYLGPKNLGAEIKAGLTLRL